MSAPVFLQQVGGGLHGPAEDAGDVPPGAVMAGEDQVVVIPSRPGRQPYPGLGGAVGAPASFHVRMLRRRAAVSTVNDGGSARSAGWRSTRPQRTASRSAFRSIAWMRGRRQATRLADPAGAQQVSVEPVEVRGVEVLQRHPADPWRGVGLQVLASVLPRPVLDPRRRCGLQPLPIGQSPAVRSDDST